MKKYFKPETNIVKMDLLSFVADSGGEGVQQDGFKASFEFASQNKGNASSARAKSFQGNGLWDDDEIEE